MSLISMAKVETPHPANGSAARNPLPASGEREKAAALSLLTASAVRERAHEMLAAGLRGELAHFTVDL